MHRCFDSERVTCHHPASGVRRDYGRAEPLGQRDDRLLALGARLRDAATNPHDDA